MNPKPAPLLAARVIFAAAFIPKWDTEVIVNGLEGGRGFANTHGGWPGIVQRDTGLLQM